MDPPPESPETVTPSGGQQRRRRSEQGPVGLRGLRGLRGIGAWVAEVAVMATVLLAPLLIGSVHLWAAALELGIIVLAAGALLFALRGSGGLALPRWAILGLALLLGLELLQLVPLPPFLLELLAPRSVDLLAYSVGDLGGWPAWHPVSLDPRQTALEVARHASWLLLFVVVSQLAISRHSRRRLTILLGVLAAVLVLLAFGHKLARLELIYGFFPVKPGGFFFASFVNPNHLAALLGLLAPISLGLAFGARVRPQALLWGVVFVLTGITTVLTLSRGGMLGLTVGVAVFAVLYLRVRSADGARAGGGESGQPRPRSPWMAAGGLVAVVAVLSGVAYLALDPVLAELATLTGDGAVTGEMRLAIASDGAALIKDHWLTGVGRGAWALTFPVYRTIARSGTFVFAESQPLQALAELGMIGGLFFIGFFLWVMVRATRCVATARGAGIVAGLFALGMHEIADFSTVFGGVAVPATVAFAVACLGRRRGEEAVAKDRLVLGFGASVGGIGAIVLLAIGTLIAATGRLADDDVAWLQEEGQSTELFIARAKQAQLRHPTDHMVALVSARVLSERGEESLAMRWVSRAMYLSPTEPRPHLLAAQLLARAAKRGQSLLEFRLAAAWGYPPMAVLAAAERFFAAAAQLEQALPDEIEFRVHLCRYLRRRGRHEDLLQVAGRALETWPDSAALLFLASGSARALGKHDRGLELARRLAGIAPHDPRGPQEEARTHTARRDSRAAVVVLREALERMPGNAALSIDLAWALHRTGDLQGAARVLDRTSGLRGKGQRASFQMIRGKLLEAQGQLDEALEAYRLAGRMNENSVAAPIAEGDLLRALGRGAEALDRYRLALERSRGSQRQRVERRIEALAQARGE